MKNRRRKFKRNFFGRRKKYVIDDYLECLSKAGINAVAIEFHPLSAMRVVSSDKETYLATQKNASDASVFVFKNRVLRFLRSMPKEYVGDDSLSAEVKKIENFYATKNGGE